MVLRGYYRGTRRVLSRWYGCTRGSIGYCGVLKGYFRGTKVELRGNLGVTQGFKRAKQG